MEGIEERQLIIEKYMEYKLQNDREPVLATAREVGVDVSVVVSVVTSAWGRTYLKNLAKYRSTPDEVTQAILSKEAGSLLGITPLDVIEVGDYPGGYRLREDASPQAWNMVKRIVPSVKAHLPPALEFLSMNERIALNKQLMGELQKDEGAAKGGMFDGKIIEGRVRDNILPAVFDQPVVVQPDDVSAVAEG
jgi:hypothetical protein